MLERYSGAPVLTRPPVSHVRADASTTRRQRGRTWIGKPSRQAARPIAVGAVAAAILLFEVGLLFVGVIARYSLHRPLVWADELASTLFVWLSVLGAVLAMRRNAHMRLTTLHQPRCAGAAPADRDRRSCW